MLRIFSDKKQEEVKFGTLENGCCFLSDKTLCIKVDIPESTHNTLILGEFFQAVKTFPETLVTPVNAELKWWPK